MYTTREKFEEICKKYNILTSLDEGAVSALNFVQELSETEADAVEANKPDATESIDRLKGAAYEVFDLRCEVMEEEFWLDY